MDGGAGVVVAAVIAIPGADTIIDATADTTEVTVIADGDGHRVYDGDTATTGGTAEIEVAGVGTRSGCRGDGTCAVATEAGLAMAVAEDEVDVATTGADATVGTDVGVIAGAAPAVLEAEPAEDLPAAVSPGAATGTIPTTCTSATVAGELAAEVRVDVDVAAWTSGAAAAGAGSGAEDTLVADAVPIGAIPCTPMVPPNSWCRRLVR